MIALRRYRFPLQLDWKSHIAMLFAKPRFPANPESITSRITKSADPPHIPVNHQRVRNGYLAVAARNSMR